MAEAVAATLADLGTADADPLLDEPYLVTGTFFDGPQSPPAVLARRRAGPSSFAASSVATRPRSYE